MSSILRGIPSNHIALHDPSDPFPSTAEISGALGPPGNFGKQKGKNMQNGRLFETIVKQLFYLAKNLVADSLLLIFKTEKHASCCYSIVFP